MPKLNYRDKKICERLKNGITLADIEAVNEPEYTAWISRRRYISGVFVWELNWFITAGNFFLRFPKKNSYSYPIEVVYLPDAIIRRCHLKEECCVRHPFVMEIVAHTHFLKEKEKFISANDQAVYLGFENAEDMCGCLAFITKIAARHTQTASIMFGSPLQVQHCIHLNATNNEKNFGFELLSKEMQNWLLQQGITREEMKGCEETVLSCAETLYEYQKQIGVETNMPFSLLGENKMSRKKKEEVMENEESNQLFLLPTDMSNVTMESLLTKGDPHQLYSNWEKLDSGSQGEVFKAKRKSDGSEVAIKRITIKRVRKELSALLKEMTLLKALRHPNIVTLHECYKKEKDLFLTMELMDGGKLADLLDPIEGPRVKFTEIQLSTIMREVLLALQCLHHAKCMHRDVKSDNILLSSRGEVKLGDFGLATLVSAPKGTRRTVVGTPYWMAPEVASGKPYNIKADIWSAGILFIELCDGKPPLMGIHPVRALLKVCTGPPPVMKSAKKWSETCQEFAKYLLVKDPVERPSVDDALKHPFIKMSSESSCQFIATILKERKRE
ncbi:putative p21-activated kinase 3 [Trypanosoma theileri]|uniref:Putative p21-activated kinase 3 n=1 Tax=Trypanosoma theileri TaxID=67003 RepID=A0A1X0P4Z7_9TRYP|nr:putative p21-activated kinase 3 [Trypanosoma theileri]ORC92017.1 putative p21-activated kinase 3 [Trypanosoma theileri]